MAQSPDKGGARPVSSTDFNDRVKRLLADKPELRITPKERKGGRNFTRATPRT